MIHEQTDKRLYDGKQRMVTCHKCFEEKHEQCMEKMGMMKCTCSICFPEK